MRAFFHMMLFFSSIPSPSSSLTTGTSMMPELTHFACPAGSYCPLAAIVPLPCPPGTWSPVSGLASPSQCLSCPAGSYCVGGGTVIDGPCAPGHYCPALSFTNTTSPCPPQYYRLYPGARSEQDCALCPSGSCACTCALFA